MMSLLNANPIRAEIFACFVHYRGLAHTRCLNPFAKGEVLNLGAPSAKIIPYRIPCSFNSLYMLIILPPPLLFPYFFFKILSLNNLHNQGGAQIYNPKINSWHTAPTEPASQAVS